MSTYLSWKEVITRKAHECFGCDKKYPKGMKMVRAANADEGTVDTIYWCETCLEYINKNFYSGQETGQGEVFQNDPEGWEEIRKELEGVK